MSTVKIHEAKTHLSRLLEAVAAGEEIIIAKAGKPIAKLVPIEKPKRKPGALKRTFIIDDAFFEPLPDDGTVCPPRTLSAAWRRVACNQGAAGVDASRTGTQGPSNTGARHRRGIPRSRPRLPQRSRWPCR